MTGQTRNTLVFIGFFLLAGIANVLSMLFDSELSTLMTCLNYLIFLGLLLFWIEAVRVRLLPSRGRTYILSAAFLMLLHMLLRIFKYRIAVTAGTKRYAVYAYWIPQMLIPALFLMACIRIRRGARDSGAKYESLLLIPSGILALTAMTNDLHSLIYVPGVALPDFAVDTGTYRYGPVFWLMYVWMILTALSGIIILSRSFGKVPKRALRLLALVIVLWFGIVALVLLVIDRIPHSFKMYNVPETHIFALLAIFEICIRYRMIPYNENYSGFFRKLRITSIITDRAFSPVYRSEAVFPAGTETLRRAVREPVALNPDLKLYGKPIRAGYVFWTQDESAVHRAQERLVEANEMIEQENDLIRAETEQKEKDAYLQSRHRIYHEIAGELYPCQQRIARILSETKPGTAEFRGKIAFVSVLNAYVKRKTNLLLLAAENDTVSARELSLALEESASYLTLAGLQTTVRTDGERQIPARSAVGVYDAFEALAEQLLGKAPSLMVSWYPDGLRLAAETDLSVDTADIPLPVRLRRSEKILYLDIPAGNGGETA